MKTYAKELFQQMRDVHEFAVQTMFKFEEDIKAACNGDKHECADIAYALREIRELAEDIRKRADLHGRTAQSAGCMLAITESDPSSIRTEYCTATPTCKTIVKIPKLSNDPEGFAALMKHLGVPDDLWVERKHAAVSVNWPGLVDLLSQQQAEGKPLPEGIDPNSSYTDYSLRILGRKPIVEQSQQIQEEGTPF